MVEENQVGARKPTAAENVAFDRLPDHPKNIFLSPRGERELRRAVVGQPARMGIARAMA